MVAHRSPKPPVRVRILLPLPFYLISELIFISNYLIKTIIFLAVIILIICIFFTPIIASSGFTSFTSPEYYDGEFLQANVNGFVWPIPGYTRISSAFGKRNAPTAGASSFHYGCDIPAPTGTKLVAICDGQITFAQFLGAGGYTITLSFANFKVTYCHVDPNFLVSVGDNVKQGQVIASVGPYIVYGVPGNPYKDANGNPTNGATTGPHFHIGMRIDGNYVNPLDYISSSSSLS